MKSSKKYLDEFKALYLKKYGIELSDSETYKLATHLLRMVKLVCRKDGANND